jgi:DNA-directed RNA polymerase specialized sigma24 family protein
VREVLAGLPNDLRSILLLNETEGWTIAEIAAMMKMRPGTIGRKLAEAKEMFRQRITAR